MAPFAEARRPGRYVLHVERQMTQLPFLEMRIERDAATAFARFRLPALQSTDYVVRLAEGIARFFLDDTPGNAISIRPARLRDLVRSVERPRVAARLRLVVDRGLSLQPLLRGAGRRGRSLVRTMRVLANRGFGLASDNLQRTPELLIDPERFSARAPVTLPSGAVTRPRFAVVVHLFYEELWPEFRYFLSRIRQPFDLILTTSLADPAFADDARHLFPGFQLIRVPNRGRDVGPFLQLLHDRRLDGTEFVLKLHGKRMETPEHLAPLGHFWRRANLIDLAGSDECVRTIIAGFDADAKIGMIGSPRFRLPGSMFPEKVAWGTNRTTTLALAERLGVPPHSFPLDYFAGTMFWVRRDTLEPLRRLNLSLSDFPEEAGQRDGELHHALERLFGILPSLAGQTLEGATPRYDP